MATGSPSRKICGPAGAGQVGHFVGEIRKLLGCTELAAEAFADMAHDGLRLNQTTIHRLAESRRKAAGAPRWALWLGALSLAAIAVSLIW